MGKLQRLCFLSVLAGAMISPGAGSALAAQNAQQAATSQQDFVQQIMERAQKPHEYSEMLHSKDPAVRMEALESALKESDPAIRGMAISEYLTRFNALTPEVVLDPSSEFTQGDMPNLAIANLNWANDGNSFTGQVASGSCAGFSVAGQIAGGSLTIRYNDLCIQPNLLNNNSNTPTSLAELACQVMLMPNAQDNALEGPLTCFTLDRTFKVNLPFGP